PVEAVSIMDRICQRTESDEFYRKIMEADKLEIEQEASDAITAAAHQVAETVKAACIVNYTSSGSTTIRTARQRPAVKILCLSHNLETARRLALSYGVHAIYVTDINSFAETVKRATVLAREEGLAKAGERL